MNKAVPSLGWSKNPSRVRTSRVTMSWAGRHEGGPNAASRDAVVTTKGRSSTFAWRTVMSEVSDFGIVISLVDRRMEEDGLSDCQSAAARDCAVDSRVVLVRANDRL